MTFLQRWFKILMVGDGRMPTEKLKELMLYIAEKCKDDPYFGAIKLNKILFLADFNNYALRGVSITGAKYVHRKRGPVPNEVLKALRLLREEGRAKIEEVPFFDYKQKRLIPLEKAKSSLFSSDELSLVDEIVEKTRFNNATELSEWSHTLMPYRITKEGEEIPYNTVYVLHKREPDAESIDWAKREVERLKDYKLIS
jgi:hypothetical protein